MIQFNSWSIKSRCWQNVSNWDYNGIKRQFLRLPKECFTKSQSGTGILTYLRKSVQPKESSLQFRQPHEISSSHDSGPVTVRARTGLNLKQTEAKALDESCYVTKKRLLIKITRLHSSLAWQLARSSFRVTRQHLGKLGSLL